MAHMRNSMLMHPGPSSNRSIGKPLLRIAEPSRAQSPLSLNSQASSSRSSNRDGLPYRLGMSGKKANSHMSSPEKAYKLAAARGTRNPYIGSQLITPGRDDNTYGISSQLASSRNMTQTTPVEDFELAPPIEPPGVRLSNPRDMLNKDYSDQ